MDYDVASFDDVIGMAQVDLVGLYYLIAKDPTVNLDEGTVDLQVTWQTAGTPATTRGAAGDAGHGDGPRVVAVLGPRPRGRRACSRRRGVGGRTT